MTERIIKTGSFKKDEDAVSPVIGVILMVAITVILAAVIGAFVFGMGSGVSKTYNVGVTAAQNSSNTVLCTFQGGPDAAAVMYLNCSVNGATPTTATIATGPTATAGTDPVPVGKTWYGGMATSGQDHVIITARFTDDSVQVVLDTYV